MQQDLTSDLWVTVQRKRGGILEETDNKQESCPTENCTRSARKIPFGCEHSSDFGLVACFQTDVMATDDNPFRLTQELQGAVNRKAPYCRIRAAALALQSSPL